MHVLENLNLNLNSCGLYPKVDLYMNACVRKNFSASIRHWPYYSKI